MRRDAAGFPALLTLLGLTLAACTGHAGPSPGAARAASPTPIRFGSPAGSVVVATAAAAGVLTKMAVTPPPPSEVPAAVHNLLTVDVTTRVRALATYGSFTSGSQFSVAGLVSPLTGGSRTALIRLRGPGYDGRHQAAVDQNNFVTATLTLPKLAPGRWYIAIEDLSQVHPGAEGLETGYAVLDLAIYDVK